MNLDSEGTATAESRYRIAIVGGGLAGLAAAVALSESKLQRQSQGHRLQIELFESRRMLGGRATSYRDPISGELIDNCQHVSLGCCTNFDDFCRRSGIERRFRREHALNFVAPDGRLVVVQGSKWLPAPLHLTTSLMRVSFLSRRERARVVLGLLRLARTRDDETSSRMTFGEWLRQQGQTDNAIALFWSPVIVSALSEEVDRADLRVSRKVFVDAFLRQKRGCELTLPTVPLRTLYEEHLAKLLSSRGIKIRLGDEVQSIEPVNDAICKINVANGATDPFDAVLVTVPWYRVRELFDPSLVPRLSFLDAIPYFEEVPITSVHLWCSRAIPLPRSHLVLPGRLSQWVFDRSQGNGSHYYQVVISAARGVAAISAVELVERIGRELEETFGSPVRDSIERSKVISEQRSVFSPTPSAEQHRPPQQTAISNLFLAGDWTATGWPATMEGAVRSGYLAAELVLGKFGAPEAFVAADLPPAALTRWLFNVR